MRSLPSLTLAVLFLSAGGAGASVIEKARVPLTPPMHPRLGSDSPSANVKNVAGDVEDMLAFQDYNTKLKALAPLGPEEQKKLGDNAGRFDSIRKGLLEDVAKLQKWADASPDADTVAAGVTKEELAVTPWSAPAAPNGPRQSAGNVAELVKGLLSQQKRSADLRALPSLDAKAQESLDAVRKDFLTARGKLLAELDELAKWAAAAKDVDAAAWWGGAPPRRAEEKAIDPEKIKKSIDGVIKLEGDPTLPSQLPPQRDQLDEEVKKKVESLIKKDEKPRGIPGALRRKK